MLPDPLGSPQGEQWPGLQGPEKAPMGGDLSAPQGGGSGFSLCSSVPLKTKALRSHNKGLASSGQWDPETLSVRACASSGHRRAGASDST